MKGSQKVGVFGAGGLLRGDIETTAIPSANGGFDLASSKVRDLEQEIQRLNAHLANARAVIAQLESRLGLASGQVREYTPDEFASSHNFTRATVYRWIDECFGKKSRPKNPEVQRPTGVYPVKRIIGGKQRYFIVPQYA